MFNRLFVLFLALFLIGCAAKKKFIVIENIQNCADCKKQMFHLEAIKDNEVRLEKLDSSIKEGDIIPLKSKIKQNE